MAVSASAAGALTSLPLTPSDLRSIPLTPTQKATVALANHILNAPPEHIAAEPPECLVELIDTIIENLNFMDVGIGWLVIQLNLLRAKVEPKDQMELI